ncbi:MAG: hypothetical protein L3J45_02645, partial [Flavobacteriaceae bacterium]|nr:hypothetical protein [Flavobacteriaceae bacterium]
MKNKITLLALLFISSLSFSQTFVNLQWPHSGSINVGDTFNVYAQVYEAGITDATGQGAGINAWIGYSTTNTNPNTWTNWVVASYNTDQGNNDEYIANIGFAISSSGTYYYASRFQLNSGSFTYGGINSTTPSSGGGNTWDGTTYISGVLKISVTTWTGTSTTDWNTAGNWDNGIPTASLDAVVPNVSNKPIIANTNMVCNNLTIDASSSLTINTAKGLTISGNLVNNGAITVASDATTSGSLIVSGTSTGNITYNRYLTSTSSTKWHLIAAPIGAQSINTFATTGANNIATNGVNYSVTPYDNTVAKGATGTWSHWTSDGTGAGNISGAGNFTAGKGYEILTTADGTVAFTGTVPTSQVSIAITKPGSANAWNLIGNPFPSSLFANSSADATNNFITVNSAAMDASFQAIYLWNPGTSTYDLINQASATTYIAPGQGFFVKSVSAGATVNFTTAMRTNQSGVAFQRTATTRPTITLSVDNNAGKTKTTAIKYIAGKSLGLDPGYDAGLFDASGGNFNLYTKLVADNGVNFMLQVLPDNVYDTTVIPIGLDADAGTQITFKATYSNLPIGKKVFLEDRLIGS